MTLSCDYLEVWVPGRETQQASIELAAQISPLPLLASDAPKPKDQKKKKELTVLGYVIDPDYQDEIRFLLHY